MDFITVCGKNSGRPEILGLAVERCDIEMNTYPLAARGGDEVVHFASIERYLLHKFLKARKVALEPFSFFVDSF